jgi:hypothetical protein
MRTRDMEDAQGFYNHEEEIGGLHTSMGNVETESNGRRDRQGTVTMRSLQKEVQSYRADNERIMKAQEEILQSLNMLQKQVNKDSGTKQATSARQVSTSRSHRKRDDHGNDRKSRSMSRCHHSPRHSTRRTHASSGPGSSPSVSHVQRQRRRPEADILQGELRKIKPPNFNGEHKKGEDVEAWLLEMKKYFQLHDYPSRVEARISTYHLQGKETMWWDQLKQTKNLDEKRISWRQFKGYFQEKYLSEHYYERKMKEFFELKLGTMTMEEYEKWFFELLKYVDFIKDEKVKIQRFLSGLPSFYSDKIQYDNPKTLEETIRRARHLYEQSKGRPIFQKSWNDKMKDKKDQRKKGFKPPFFRNNFQVNQHRSSHTK